MEESRLNGMLQELENQRALALTRCAHLAGEIEFQKAQIESLNARLKEQEEKISELTPKESQI